MFKFFKKSNSTPTTTEIPSRCDGQTAIKLLSTIPVDQLTGLQISGNLNLIGTGCVCLPEGFVVEGDLYLDGCPIETLPENIKVGGTLSLECCPITLPQKGWVWGNLNLHGTPVGQVPHGFTVMGEVTR